MTNRRDFEGIWLLNNLVDIFSAHHPNPKIFSDFWNILTKICFGFWEPLAATKNDDGKSVRPEAADALHGLQFNLGLFHNKTMLVSDVDGAAEIFTRQSVKNQKALKAELESVQANPPDNFAALVIATNAAPIMFTEGTRLSSDGKRGNFFIFTVKNPR